MEQWEVKDNDAQLPEMFRQLLWSYRFEAIDPYEHREEIILNTINFGNLDHWRWLIGHYGKDEIRRVLQCRMKTEVNPESRNLSRLIFGVNHWRYAQRGAD